MSRKVKITVLVSGGGTNLQSLIDNIENGSLQNAEIVQVISSRKDAFALKRASDAGIKGIVISKENFPDADELASELIKKLEMEETDLIVLAGYMSIVHPDVIRKYPKRIINIHPSLIPKYSGKGFYGKKVHEAVIEAGEKVSGATVHFVDEGIDTGEIILQREVTVRPGDDAEALAKRVLEVEHLILTEALRRVISVHLRA
jgi:phosphoribosylglycinamide formyltransferase-1